jgi:predicted dehydrogenase
MAVAVAAEPAAQVTGTAPPLRLAVLGAGLGSPPHLRSLADLAQEVEVAWVYGRSLERLQAMPVPGGARLTTRLEDIFDDRSVQAVLILTPPNVHLELAEKAARAGKHVLVEKPLEVDLARATALVQACEAAGVSLAVMLQHRLRPGAAALAEMLRTGALGQVLGAGAFVRWWRPQSYYDEPGRGTLARDGGGVLMTQAIHTLDLLLQLIGLPERVSGAAGTSPLHRMECEDTAAALLHYASGMTAVVQATTAACPGYAERIELDGTLGTATLESGVLTVRMAQGETVTVGASVGTGGGSDPMAFDHGPHRSVLQDFIRAVRSGTPPAVTGRSALDVQRVIDAIMRSARSGHTVSLGA